LLALLVHPVPAPDGGDISWDRYPALWTRAAQVWACLGLLHHDTGERWARSTRRQVLVDLAFGVEDWTAEAALYALMTAAWVDPSIRSDVADLVRERIGHLAKARAKRPVTIGGSLARIALATPEIDAKTRSLAEQILKDDE
jgi:hypothetical protein